MSSSPRPPAPAPKPGAPVRPAGVPGARPGAPAKPKGREPVSPVQLFTPQAIIVVFLIILVVGGALYFQLVYRSMRQQIQKYIDDTATQKRTNEQLQKQASLLPQAIEVRKLMEDKLVDFTKFFLVNQFDVIPFFTTYLPDALDVAGINQPYKIKVSYVFKMSSEGTPFETLPMNIEDPEKSFTWQYTGKAEKGKGSPDEQYGQPSTFLEGLTFTISDMNCTYEELQKAIRYMQMRSTYVLTVHCFKNDEQKNVYLYRTWSSWTTIITVYFMNPKAPAAGDDPPVPPESQAC